MTGPYQGWTCRWADRVLHATGPEGQRRSVAEVYVRPRGGPRWEVLHPTSGRILGRGDAPSLVEARSCAAQIVADHGGSFDEPVEPAKRRRGGRGHTPARDAVVACVLRHPEGISAGGVAAEVGGTPAAASQALSDARRLGLVRHTGARSAARYWPPDPPAVDGASRPEPSVAAVQSVAESPIGEPGGGPVAAPAAGPAPTAAAELRPVPFDPWDSGPTGLEGFPPGGALPTPGSGVAELALVDRVLDEAGVLPGWPRAVRLGAALERLGRTT